ncbi:hypothetical protein niasHS_014024 [Heterodera schachtii]|uniref:Uncharacterized protein n=1 Tax=Heterodera schachtii TaxID=97005 RepID=A0ABD2INU6_HETSC
MFRKPKQKHNLRKPTADKRSVNQDEEDEEDLEEVESRIQDVLEAQKVRQRRSGMDAVECAVGKDLAREFQRMDENPFQMRGGAMLRLSDHQKAALSAADIEADIKEQFKKETLLRDEHEEMRRYVETRIASECPAALAIAAANAKESAGDGGGPSTAKKVKVAGPEDDILYRAAEQVKHHGSKRNEELLSNQMLVGIPEVDLGIETRMRNIEATEQKKVELLKKGAIPKRVNNWQPLLKEETTEE